MGLTKKFKNLTLLILFMTIRTFEDFKDMIFSLLSEFDKLGKTIQTYESMRNIIDKNKARAQFKDFFETVDNSVNLVLEALNNELIDIL